MAQLLLDQASTRAPKPEGVLQAVTSALQAEASLASHAAPVRERLAALLGAEDPARILFTSGAGDAMSLAFTAALRPGDHVVTTSLEHDLVARALRALRQTRGVEATVVPAASDGSIDVKGVASAFRPHTRLLVCTHASHVLGTIAPVAELVRLAHGRGAAVLCDGAQTAGNLPFSLFDLGVDLFAFSGHKGLLGPAGIGGLVVASSVDLAALAARSGVVAVPAISPVADPFAGVPDATPSDEPYALALAGLGAGLACVEKRGVAAIAQHEQSLSERLAHELAQIRGVVVHSPIVAERRVGIVCANFTHLPAAEAGAILATKFGVHVAYGLHQATLLHQQLGLAATGTLRFSVGATTTSAQVDAAVDAVREMSAILYRRRPSALSAVA